MRQHHLNSRGFTLLELLVVVVIIGIVAAIGGSWVRGYVENSKKVAAENGLRSIYLMEKEWLNEEGVYYGTGRGDHTAKINTELFSGNQTLDESGDYAFQIVAVGSTKYQAHAKADGKDTLCIDHNSKTGCD
jgi:prepilin-type N-terminal cleavage/methylation domain-containing protein